MVSPRPGLDVLIRNGAGGCDAPLRGDDFTGVAGQPRGLRKRPAGAAFDHPDVRLCRPSQPERFQHQAAVDPDHRQHDAEQQTQAKAGQQEAAEIVPDIFQREVHVTARWW